MLFASIMETLGNEALGKILNLLDEVGLTAEPPLGRGARRLQTSVLNVLSNAHIGKYWPRPKTPPPSLSDITLTVLCLWQSSSTRMDSGSRAVTQPRPLR